MIITNKSERKIIPFGQLMNGDIYRDPDDGDIMMKILPRGEDTANAVSFNDGCGYLYYDSTLVELLENVELIIR